MGVVHAAAEIDRVALFDAVHVVDVIEDMFDAPHAARAQRDQDDHQQKDDAIAESQPGADREVLVFHGRGRDKWVAKKTFCFLSACANISPDIAHWNLI
jgi:hypothetical protein